MEPNFNELNNTDHEDAPHLFETLSPEYTDIPDPEHFDTICEGALDTVKGMESMSTTYTKAQSYLFACMSAADHIGYQQQRAGMEGLFSAIGDGLGAAWDFIKKIFTAVWRAFFGGGEDTVEAKAEKTEKKVKENKEAMQEDDKTGKSAEVVEKQRKKAKEKANKIKKDPKASSSDKAVADQIIKTIDEGNVKSTSQKEQDLKKVKDSFIKIDKDVREWLIKRVGETEALQRKFKEYFDKDHSSEIKIGRWKSTYDVFQTTVKRQLLGDSVAAKVKIDSIKTSAQAIEAQGAVAALVDSHFNVAKTIRGEKSDLEKEIQELETALRKKGKGSTKGDVLGESYNTKDQVRERLACAKVVLGIINATAGYQTKALQSLERLSMSLKDAYSPLS